MLRSPSTFRHRCGVKFRRSHTLPKLAQNPRAAKHQPIHASRVYCHLQPYKRLACMVRNCGMVLIRIRHAQNVIRSNQYPIKFVFRGYREVPPYTSCFLRTSRNRKKRLLYEKTYRSSILWRRYTTIFRIL